MKKLTATIAFALLIVFGSVGCEQSAPSSGVAVIDVDQIMRTLQVDQQINQQMQQVSTDANNHLVNLRRSVTTELQSRQKQLGETPSDEQRAAFNEFARSAEQQFSMEVGRVEDQVARLRSMMFGQFMQQVEPVARAVASNKGAQVVLVNGQSVMSFDPQVDITLDVIEAIQESGSGISISIPAPAGQPAGTPGSPGFPGAPGIPGIPGSPAMPQGGSPFPPPAQQGGSPAGPGINVPAPSSEGEESPINLPDIE